MASTKIDTINNENQLKDVTLILELIKDNLCIWGIAENKEDDQLVEEEVLCPEEEVNQSYS